MSVLAYLALGSNLGDRRAHFEAARRGLAEAEGVRPRRLSAVYRTPPVGPPPQEDYWNAVVEVESDRTADDLLALAQALEARCGRERTVRWGPRTLDLDLLLYGEEERDDAALTLPHPRLHERAFVLRPLADLVPERRIRGRTVEDWLSRCSLAGIEKVANPWD